MGVGGGGIDINKKKIYEHNNDRTFFRSKECQKLGQFQFKIAESQDGMKKNIKMKWNTKNRVNSALELEIVTESSL